MMERLQIVELALIAAAALTWFGVLVFRAHVNQWTFSEGLRLMAAVTTAWGLQLLDRLSDLYIHIDMFRELSSTAGALAAAWFVRVAVGRGWHFWCIIAVAVGFAVLTILGYG